MENEGVRIVMGVPTEGGKGTMMGVPTFGGEIIINPANRRRLIGFIKKEVLAQVS
jgi:hypothetical protein